LACQYFRQDQPPSPTPRHSGAHHWPGSRARRGVGATPVSEDFWACAAEHPETAEFGVCCIFYNGDFDEQNGECSIDHEAKLEEAAPGLGVPPKHPVLTQVGRVRVATLG
jgi:hypothetical protein